MMPTNLIDEIRKQTAEWSGPVLSIYLDIDASDASNLNGGFQTRFNSAYRKLAGSLKLEGDSAAAFAEAVDKAVALLKDFRPAGKTLSAFVNASSGTMWQRELQIRLATSVEWGDGPFLKPVLHALDEHERFGVVLIDRAHARVFTVCLGEVREWADLFADDVRRTHKTPHDMRWSQANIQRRVDGHVKQHAREAAEALLRIDRDFRFDRILLAGTLDARKEVEHELPTRMRRKVVGSSPSKMRVAERDIREMVERFEAKAERAEEKAVVARLLTAAKKGKKAVVGLNDTVEALTAAGVMRLVCAADFHPKTPPSPPEWLGGAEPLDRMIERCSETGGEVEIVAAEAAARLSEEGGGIGAFLRY